MAAWGVGAKLEGALPNVCSFALKIKIVQPKPNMGCILSEVTQKPIPRAPSPSASTTFPLLWMLKHTFLACFEPVVSRFGPPKAPKGFESAPLEPK